jgi:hypothetical protein
MAHAHIDRYTGTPTARAKGGEVHIDIGDLLEGDSTIRIAMTGTEALALAVEMIAAAQSLTE